MPRLTLARLLPLALPLALVGLTAIGPQVANSQAERGGRVLFISNRAGELQYDIFSVKSDGAGEQRLTTTDALEFDPVWSPDGKKIAFAGSDNLEERKSDIYVMNADGTGKTSLTSSPMGTLALGPAWSPDGKRLAYSTLTFGDGQGDMKLHLMDADGANSSELGEGAQPSWSPDGKRLVAMELAERPSLFILDLATGARTDVTPNGGVMGVFSPDGKQIAYVGLHGDRATEIHLMSADGTNDQRLTDTAELEVGLSWSADGKSLYFTRMQIGDGMPPSGDIFRLNLADKQEKQLTTDPALDYVGGGFILVITRLNDN